MAAQDTHPLKTTRRTRLKRNGGLFRHIRNCFARLREEYSWENVADGVCGTLLPCQRVSVARVRLSVAGRDGFAPLGPVMWCWYCRRHKNGAQEAAGLCTRVWHYAPKCVPHGSWRNGSRPPPKQGVICFFNMSSVPLDTRFVFRSHRAATIICLVLENTLLCTAQLARGVSDA